MQALRRSTWPHLGRAQILFEKAWRWHPLGLAIFISLVIHLIFLSFRWGLGEIHSRRLNTPLSVVLVNASSHAKTTVASKLAQVDLQGSGSSADQDATALHRARLGSEARLEVLEKQQKQMLAKLEAERLKSCGQKVVRHSMLCLSSILWRPSYHSVFRLRGAVHAAKS